MVYFKEALPNPVGRDTEGEWIKLINTGDAAAELAGWSITDAGGKVFFLGALKNPTVLPGEELTLPYSVTRVSLNNDGDTLTLKTESGEAVDTLTYEGPVADDEIVFADRFSPEEAREVSGTIKELAFAGKDVPVDTALFSTLLIALVGAALGGVLAALFAKQLFEREV